MRNDSNSYIRSRSADVLGQLTSLDEDSAAVGRASSLRLPKTYGHAWRSARCAFALIALLSFALASAAADSAGPSQSGVIPTREGLQLTFKAVCAGVRIFTDAPHRVSYAVRPQIASDAGYLQDFSVTALQTPRGVVLVGRVRNAGDCRGGVIYEIHVPHRYDLNITVQSGAIVVQDIDGSVTLSTGGGDLRVGRVGASDSSGTNLGNAPFIAQLETAGGDVSVGDIAGGLRAATGGGRISAGDVRGPAVLRTGGGDIRVGHVFGAARFSSGGGNISARKIDGGLWAQADGGRVEIGDAAGLAAFAPEFSADSTDEFPAVVLSGRFPGRQDALAPQDMADIAEFARLFDVFFWGGIRVDPAEEQKHLLASVAPAYPEVARLAGLSKHLVQS